MGLLRRSPSSLNSYRVTTPFCFGGRSHKTRLRPRCVLPGLGAVLGRQEDAEHGTGQTNCFILSTNRSTRLTLRRP